MRHEIFLILLSIFYLSQIQAQVSKSNEQKEQNSQESKVMSEAYQKFWNQEFQLKVDRDIDQNRKAEAVCHLNGIKRGTEVKIEGINMNGHAIIYGMRRWGHPTWMPEDRKAMEPLFEAHVRDLALRYKGRIQHWDVVNESINQANWGLRPMIILLKHCGMWQMVGRLPESLHFQDSMIRN
jgi:GH35 family endo-1,4-beta-xylanase